MNSALHLLGIARKAGRLEIGEEPVAAAVRAGHARLVLVAGDAAENSVRRASRFAGGGRIPWVQTPFNKLELGRIVGRASCAMLAITDFGLAAAVAGRLSSLDPERYGAVSRELEVKAAKALERQKEQRRHEKNLQRGRRKPWSPPPVKSRETGAVSPEKLKPKRPVPRGVMTVKRKKTP